jgi:hypothetical protein
LFNCHVVHIVPELQSWVDRIQAVVPGTGQRVWWNGLWMQKAPGVSMRQLAAATLPHLIKTFQLGILQVRVWHKCCVSM